MRLFETPPGNNQPRRGFKKITGRGWWFCRLLSRLPKGSTIPITISNPPRSHQSRRGFKEITGRDWLLHGSFSRLLFKGVDLVGLVLGKKRKWVKTLFFFLKIIFFWKVLDFWILIRKNNFQNSQKSKRTPTNPQIHKSLSQTSKNNHQISRKIISPEGGLKR